jgi:hypothetical protein
MVDDEHMCVKTSGPLRSRSRGTGQIGQVRQRNNCSREYAEPIDTTWLEELKVGPDLAFTQGNAQLLRTVHVGPDQQLVCLLLLLLLVPRSSLASQRLNISSVAMCLGV